MIYLLNILFSSCCVNRSFKVQQAFYEALRTRDVASLTLAADTTATATPTTTANNNNDNDNDDTVATTATAVGKSTSLMKLPRLGNVFMQLRKCCNHPCLLDAMFDQVCVRERMFLDLHKKK